MAKIINLKRPLDLIPDRHFLQKRLPQHNGNLLKNLFSREVCTARRHIYWVIPLYKSQALNEHILETADLA